MTPALLTRIVTVPNAFSAGSNARFIAARSSTSAVATAVPPAFSIFPRRLQPFGTARHQRHFRAIGRQHFGETQAQPARCAGHQRDAAGEVEQFGCFHAHRPPLP